MLHNTIYTSKARLHASQSSFRKVEFRATYVDYFHSSAAFYELNTQHPNVEIIHYDEFEADVSSPSGDDT